MEHITAKKAIDAGAIKFQKHTVWDLGPLGQKCVLPDFSKEEVDVRNLRTQLVEKGEDVLFKKEVIKYKDAKKIGGKHFYKTEPLLTKSKLLLLSKYLTPKEWLQLVYLVSGEKLFDNPIEFKRNIGKKSRSGRKKAKEESLSKIKKEATFLKITVGKETTKKNTTAKKLKTKEAAKAKGAFKSPERPKKKHLRYTKEERKNIKKADPKLRIRTKRAKINKPETTSQKKGNVSVIAKVAHFDKKMAIVNEYGSIRKYKDRNYDYTADYKHGNKKGKPRMQSKEAILATSERLQANPIKPALEVVKRAKKSNLRAYVCIKKDGYFFRVDKAKADRAVREQKFEYCSKTEYKAAKGSGKTSNSLYLDAGIINQINKERQAAELAKRNAKDLKRGESRHLYCDVETRNGRKQSGRPFTSVAITVYAKRIKKSFINGKQKPPQPKARVRTVGEILVYESTIGQGRMSSSNKRKAKRKAQANQKVYEGYSLNCKQKYRAKSKSRIAYLERRAAKAKADYMKDEPKKKEKVSATKVETFPTKKQTKGQSKQSSAGNKKDLERSSKKSTKSTSKVLELQEA